jgi:hypothetical protein
LREHSLRKIGFCARVLNCAFYLLLHLFL